LSNPTITLSGPLAAGTYSLGTPATTQPTPPATPPASTGKGGATIYQNGVFNWDGTWDFGATQNFQDTTGKPQGGVADVAVTVLTPWGGFLPYLLAGFDLTPYKFLTFSAKPTVPNQIIASQFHSAADATDGISVSVAGPGITKYGPVPQPGIWANYKVPLADFQLTVQQILKVAFADGTGDALNTLMYFDNIQFTAS
jgi:hypothetical protein